LADLDHLLLALALAGWVGGLPLERFPRLRAIFAKVGRASAIKTTIVALIDGRKARPRALLLLLLNWLCWRSIESCLLGWSSYPSARQVTSGRGSRGSARNQLMP
jgi:hypothetical protein